MNEPRPQRYQIEALLNSGVQPFSDLDEEALDALGKGIGRRPLAVPIVISSDGVLLDGHQRLKAMSAHGRKYIDAADVRVMEKVTAANALEEAVRLNVQRRHLSVSEKADVARRLQRERKWSQGKIAKLFGVSRPAVSQWLKDDDDRPATVVGTDGVVQPGKKLSKKPPRPKPAPDPWDIYHGPVLKLVEQVEARLRKTDNWPDRQTLTEQEWDIANDRLQRLEAIVGEILARVPEEELANPHWTKVTGHPGTRVLPVVHGQQSAEP